MGLFSKGRPRGPSSADEKAPEDTNPDDTSILFVPSTLSLLPVCRRCSLNLLRFTETMMKARLFYPLFPSLGAHPPPISQRPTDPTPPSVTKNPIPQSRHGPLEGHPSNVRPRAKEHARTHNRFHGSPRPHIWVRPLFSASCRSATPACAVSCPPAPLTELLHHAVFIPPLS